MLCMASASRWRSSSAPLRISSKFSVIAWTPLVAASAVSAGDVARPFRRAFERLVEHVGEAGQPLVELDALAVERG